MHPSAVAALGIREWDAVSLTGSRTTAAVAGLAGPDTPVGTVLLDDVTLSNAGLREDTAVIVSSVTVYGARSVTLSGSGLATQSISPVTLRQALLGKVMTVGDAVSLLPRDLGPGTSTSAATRALAASVGISWTSELLTVTDVDPAGPVSVQPNSLVTWGIGVPGRRVNARTAEHRDAGDPGRGAQGLAAASRQARRMAQAGTRRTAPAEDIGRGHQPRCAGVGAGRRGQGDAGARGVRRPQDGGAGRPGGRRADADDRLKPWHPGR